MIICCPLLGLHTRLLVGFVYLAAIFHLYLPYASGLHDDDCELCFATIIYRHGDRAPVRPYPTDPYKDAKYWPNGWGQLTKLGKLQQFELGRWLRNRYWNFLPLKYNVCDIYVRSTDVDRTLMSAYCNLAGLYECWNDGSETEFMYWQPVPVHTVPLEMDSVLAAHKECPLYDAMYQELLQSDEVCTVNEYYKQIFVNLSKNAGININSVRDCVSLYSTLNIEYLHGHNLPEWTKTYYPSPLKEIAEFAFKLPCFTTPLKRLKCGPLLKDIIQHMDDKKEGRITEKVWMYSAHETTLTNLMQCLNVYDGSLPQYTNTIILELFRANEDFYVILSYKTPTTFKVLRIPSCDRVCPYDSFKNIVSPVIPVNWEDECYEGFGCC